MNKGDEENLPMVRHLQSLAKEPTQSTSLILRAATDHWEQCFADKGIYVIDGVEKRRTQTVDSLYESGTNWNIDRLGDDSRRPEPIGKIGLSIIHKAQTLSNHINLAGS